MLAGLALLGALRLHTRDVNLFALIVPALAAFGVLVVVATYRKRDKVTREPFEDD
jgi:UDP:flavonoid glycosyltransferase YjiC (YdhE family)